jgi:Nucleotide-diphospho-sugar transferase
MLGTFLSSTETSVAEQTRDSNQSNVTILVAFNSGMLDLFVNWFAHLERLELSSNVIIVSEDGHRERVLSALDGATTTRGGGSIQIVNQLDALQVSGDAARYAEPVFNKVTRNRASNMLDALKRCEAVLYVDVDTVLVRNPLEFIDVDSATRSLWVGVERRRPTDGTVAEYCTGVMLAKRSDAARRLLTRWRDDMQRPSAAAQNDQLRFNRMVQRLQEAELRDAIGALPVDSFPSGRVMFGDNAEARAALESSDRLAVVHANWIVGHDAKRQALADRGYWISDNMSG